MKLIYEESRTEVKVGDAVQCDGENFLIDDIQYPHKPESTGRVYLTPINGGPTREYFPSVIKAKWICREDHQDARSGYVDGVEIDDRNWPAMGDTLACVSTTYNHLRKGKTYVACGNVIDNLVAVEDETGQVNEFMASAFNGFTRKPLPAPTDGRKWRRVTAYILAYETIDNRNLECEILLKLAGYSFRPRAIKVEDVKDLKNPTAR